MYRPRSLPCVIRGCRPEKGLHANHMKGCVPLTEGVAIQLRKGRHENQHKRLHASHIKGCLQTIRRSAANHRRGGCSVTEGETW